MSESASDPHATPATPRHQKTIGHLIRHHLCSRPGRTGTRAPCHDGPHSSAPLRTVQTTLGVPQQRTGGIRRFPTPVQWSVFANRRRDQTRPGSGISQARGPRKHASGTRWSVTPPTRDSGTLVMGRSRDASCEDLALVGGHSLCVDMSATPRRVSLMHGGTSSDSCDGAARCRSGQPDRTVSVMSEPISILAPGRGDTAKTVPLGPGSALPSTTIWNEKPRAASS